MNLSQIRSTCNHTGLGHMFYHVLCPNRSLAKRVTNVVTGGLLLIGILFSTYSVLKNRFSKPGRQGGIPEYPSEGKLAMQFAIESLKKYPNITAYQFKAGWHSIDETHQPVDTQIAFLDTLLWDVHFKALKEALKRYQKDPWNEQEVLQAADACMKIAYTIGCLTLEDLKPFNEQLKKNGKDERTYAKTLTEQDSYQYKTFYYCTNVYHWIRGGIVCNGDKLDYSYKWVRKGEIWDGNKLEKNPEESSVWMSHAQLFYTKGTMQNSWNQLYNDYCSRVRAFVNEKDLQDKDQRHVRWTVQDTGIKTFQTTPDTQPT